jgi:hypothetical protein
MSSAIPLAAKLPKLCTAASRLKRCRPAPGSQRRISHGVPDRRIRRSGRTCPTAYAYGCLYNVAGVSNPLLLARKEQSSKAFSDRRSASRAVQSVKEGEVFHKVLPFPVVGGGLVLPEVCMFGRRRGRR